VNDYPAESIKDSLKEFKGIKLLENGKNLGFGLTVNRGVKEASNKYVMLLNTDVVLRDKSFLQALKHFEANENLFGVSFAQIEKDGSIVGRNSFFWQRGLFFHKELKDHTLGINGWAEGGTCMLDREKFLQLGGFDPIYRPFYWEDIDLSYRAWKQGYSVLFDPEILVEHHHEGTTGKYFLKSHVEIVAFRNQFLFIWKNITDRSLISEHIRLKINFLKGLFLALPVLFKIEKKRTQKYGKSDIELLKLF
jgi:GT2 family glycosyltransferase